MAARVPTFKDPFRIMVELRLRELESFIEISQKASEEFARRSKKDLEEAMSRAIEENKSADPLEIIQIHSVADYVSALYETTPLYLGYSFVIIVCNVFEDLGKNFHKELKERKIIREGDNLSSYDFLENFKAKVTEKAGIAFVEYSALRDFKYIRNNIVHRGGYLGDEKDEDKQKNLQRIVETNSTTLSLRDDGQIQVAAEYAIENLNLIKQFFSKALDQTKFEDGYSWSIPPKTFAVTFDGATFSISIGSSSAEPEDLKDERE